MQAVPAIFSLLVAAAGWFYLFYSRAANRLSGIEHPKLNGLRIRLRRVGATAMILLAVAFAVGYYGIDEFHQTSLFAIAWLAVLILVPVILVAGIADLRLTQKLRRARLTDRLPKDKVP